MRVSGYGKYWVCRMCRVLWYCQGGDGCGGDDVENGCKGKTEDGGGGVEVNRRDR